MKKIDNRRIPIEELKALCLAEKPQATDSQIAIYIIANSAYWKSLGYEYICKELENLEETSNL